MNRFSTLPLLLGLVAIAGCGARTNLLTDGERDAALEAPPPATSAFCEQASYRSGYASLGVFILLDASDSMHGKRWDQATAAVSAFVSDPKVDGMRAGLRLFPIKNECEPEAYAVPSVPIQPLPGNAAAIAQALGSQIPGGETPTRPALRGAIEHARTLSLVDPSTKIVVALITDGAPNACSSTAYNTAKVAADGASSDPQVLTFVIALLDGYVEDMRAIANAGGTGEPIILGSDMNAPQALVDSLRDLVETEIECRYAVPPVDGELRGQDVSVQLRLSADLEPVSLRWLSGSGACGSSDDAYYLADPEDPSVVQLCPFTCQRAHQHPGSNVTVVAGCGTGVPEAGTADVWNPEGGESCEGIVQFSCISECGSTDFSTPVCREGFWVCPEGTVSTEDCQTCPAVPHQCCASDGYWSEASCIDQQWVCAPGAVLVGDPGCAPPDVCGGLIPCPSGYLCSVDDFTCGESGRIGSCRLIPSGCGVQEPVACGCDGIYHDNECMANAAGVDLGLNCHAPQNRLDCGPFLCAIGDLCRDVSSFLPGEPLHRYDCLDHPPQCADPCDCDLCPPCPAGAACKENCSYDSLSSAWTLHCAQL